jgi:hypothetical protein
MWHILKAEIEYNKLNYALFLLLLVPVLTYGALRESAAPAFLAWLFMFLMVNNWNAFRIREKRSFQMVQLPVAARTVGMARLALLVFFSGSYIGIYALLHAIILPGSAIGGRIILSLFALTVGVFALALMFRDRFVGTRALKQGKVLLVVLLGLAVVANFYLLILARRAAESHAAEPGFVKVIEFAAAHNPTRTAGGTALFVVICLGLGLLSAFTFARRKTHVE